MKEYACSKEKFLKNVSGNLIEILVDNGVNRHIRFRHPTSGLYWFELVTWPGLLCIHGDCGTYVFSRMNDMFEFFRQGTEPLSINPGYWAEKVKAMDTTGKVLKFCEESFRRNVKERFDEWVEHTAPAKDRKEALWEEIEDTVFSHIDDGKSAAYRALENFDSNEVVGFDFGDYFEWDCSRFDFYFIWCCWAIVWGISQYDAIKENSSTAELYEALADAAKTFGEYEAYHQAKGSSEKAEKNRLHRLKLEALIDKAGASAP